jgi:protein-tyrosine kinase
MLRQTKRHAIITETNPFSPISETYRMLRTNLQFRIDEQSLKILSVCSAHAGEGKTTTLVNLAVTFAEEGKRVLLIDADLRRSTLHQIFHMSNEVGLSTLLRNKCELKLAIRNTHITNLDLIHSGPSYSNPSKLLGSTDMVLLLEQLKQQYDLILIDSPPLLDVAESKILASKSDGVVIIVKSGKTKRDAVLKVKAHLESVNVNILGVVLNNHKQKLHNDYYFNN